MPNQNNIHGDNIAGDKHIHHHHLKNNQDPIGLDPPKLQISKLPHTGSELIGRSDELAMLDKAWDDPQTNILTLKAMGGTGKTALMKTWLNKLVANKDRGVNVVYTWSFYSQGSAEDKQASSDEFFDTALRWFNYKSDDKLSIHEKGLKLAELINQQRTLVLLDGIEPLQYPQTAAMEGALHDDGLKTLFTHLAIENTGLLLISSRQEIKELTQYKAPKVITHKLNPLSLTEGTALFKSKKIRGTDQEFKDTVNEFKGHALSLSLLAKYLDEYEEGDIKQRTNLIALTDFPEITRDTRHAFNVIASYEKKLQGSSELQVLYMLGLFDRPVSKGAIQYLENAGIDAFSGFLSNAKKYKVVVKRLRAQDLLNAENPENIGALDTHPLIREYFSKRLKKTYPEAWQQAHHQLYNYYKMLPEKEQPDTLEEMEPLFAAIAHGCAAGMYMEALTNIYYPRVSRKETFLCVSLGAFGASLSVLGNFFDQRWIKPSAKLTNEAKSAVLSWAGFHLRSMQRLQEAEETMSAGCDLNIKLEHWQSAAYDKNNLCELQLLLGDIERARISAKQSVELSERYVSKGGVRQTTNICNLAYTEHQAGRLKEALRFYQRAEETLIFEDNKLISSVSGFQYCELLGDQWTQIIKRSENSLKVHGDTDKTSASLDKISLARANLQLISEIIYTPEKDYYITIFNFPYYLSITHKPPNFIYHTDDLHMARIRHSEIAMLKIQDWLTEAFDSLHSVGLMDLMPHCLLTRVSYYRIIALWNGHEVLCRLPKQTKNEAIQLAVSNLKEVYDMSIRNKMRLFITDCHLEAARLLMSFNRLDTVLNLNASEHIQKAKQLIEETGYKRRSPEVEYIEELLMNETT